MGTSVLLLQFVLNRLYNWCFILTVCYDVSHFLCSWTAHTTAEWSVMLELLLCWRTFWTHIAHMRHSCLYFYTKSHSLHYWIIVAVVEYVCVFALLLAILNWTLCIIDLLHFSQPCLSRGLSTMNPLSWMNNYVIKYISVTMLFASVFLFLILCLCFAKNQGTLWCRAPWLSIVNWVTVFGKRYISPCACHAGMRGSSSTAVGILNLGTRWNWLVIFMRWLFYPQEENACTHLIGYYVGPRAGLGVL